MATKNTLKEFLIAIGFKVDEQQFKRFEQYWLKTERHFAELGKRATVGGAEVVAAVTVIAEQMTKLYYVAQRAGTGVGSLQSFQFGARMVGVSADQAATALESMAQAMRLQPGTKGLLASFGINPNQKDSVKTLLQLLDVTRRMPYYQGAQYAQLFGVDEQTYFQLTKNYDTLKRQYEVRQKMASAFGLNADDLAKTSRQFNNDLIKIEARFEILGMVLAKDLLPVMEGVVRLFDRLMNVLGPLDQATHGASTAIIAFVAVIWSTTRALGVLRWALNLLGLGRGVGTLTTTAAGVGEGEGLVGAAGGAVGAAGAVTAGLVAALIGLLTVVFNRAAAEWVRKKLGLPEKITGSVVKGWGSAIGNAIAAKGRGLLGGAVSPLTPALVRLTASFEGFRKNVYRDLAGNLTVGYGHLVRPGENFGAGVSQAQASALLTSDLAKAGDAIRRLVRVNLNQNQMDALKDFVFNVGAGKFARSTLLNDLNAGDYQGAMREFMRWDKAKVNGTYRPIGGLHRRRQADADLFAKPVTLHQETNIHVAGVSDPHAASREVARQQNQVNGRLIRNLAGVVDVPGATLGATAP